MTKEIKLKAEIRTEKNGKAKEIRGKGLIPSVLYGSDSDNKNLIIKKLDFEKVYALAGESNLIDLTIGEDVSIKVIVKDTQKNPIKDSLIHVDFYKVNMNKKIITEIPLNFVGESKAVKELGGNLMKNIDSIEVECLPGDLVNNIDVDLSVLNNFDDAIRIHDLKMPAGFKIMHEGNDLVVNVIESRVEEEEPDKAEDQISDGDKKEPEKSDQDENSDNDKKNKKE